MAIRRTSHTAEVLPRARYSLGGAGGVPMSNNETTAADAVSFDLTADDVATLYTLAVELLVPELDRALSALAHRILEAPEKLKGSAAAAFVLGAWIAENYSSNLIREGQRVQRGREVGRLRATEARLQQGKRRRKAIIEAATKLYAEKPELKLRRRHYEAAITIRRMKLDHLLLSNGRDYLGPDAIARHIRAAVAAGEL
jgi:hypothetical protein